MIPLFALNLEPLPSAKGDVWRRVTGTGLAQIIAVLAVTIVTRLYAPEAFGVAALNFQWGDFPEAERASREVLSLPMHPFLTEREQDRLTAAIRAAVG